MNGYYAWSFAVDATENAKDSYDEYSKGGVSENTRICKKFDNRDYGIIMLTHETTIVFWL